jgi:hypothetical protein
VLVLGLPIVALILTQTWLALQGVLPVLDGELGDPDSYMRLNRVRQLYESGLWFDPTEPRIGPSGGHLQHWTRPLDALLLAATLPLVPVFGFGAALHWVGVVFAPFCLAGQLLALNWATRPILAPLARLVAGLLLLLQPTLVAYSSLGRPDHHAPLLLLATVILGSTIRLMDPRPHGALPAVTGLTSALAIWVSPEAVTFVLIPLAALGLRWLLGAQPSLGRLSALLGWLTLGLGLALIIERGPAGLGAVEPDRLSLVHLLPVALAAALLAGINRHQRARPYGPGRRLLCVALVPLTVVGLTLGLFPVVGLGPLGPVDPLYRSLRLERIVEIQPLLQPGLIAQGQTGEVARRALVILGLVLVVVPVLATRLRNRAWWPVALGLVVFIPLAIHQVRWSAYAQILLVVAYAPWLVWLVGKLGAPLRPPLQRPARLLVLLIGLLWPAGIAHALPQAEVPVAGAGCPLRTIAPTLNRLGNGRPGTILALADLGPELLYRTPHAVLSIPNHRPQPGFNATHQALTANPAEARSILKAWHVDWILLCPGPVERRFFGGGGETLYGRLVADAPPAWLQAIPLPSELATLRLFAVAGPDA